MGIGDRRLTASFPVRSGSVPALRPHCASTSTVCRCRALRHGRGPAEPVPEVELDWPPIAVLSGRCSAPTAPCGARRRRQARFVRIARRNATSSAASTSFAVTVVEHRHVDRGPARRRPASRWRPTTRGRCRKRSVMPHLARCSCARCRGRFGSARRASWASTSSRKLARVRTRAAQRCALWLGVMWYGMDSSDATVLRPTVNSSPRRGAPCFPPTVR